jgi:23S rRNA pseudoU1915 N3-methylase RlmH
LRWAAESRSGTGFGHALHRAGRRRRPRDGFSGGELREAEESRAARPDDHKREEAQAIRGWLMPRTDVIAVDENGPQMTSGSLATELGRA